MRQSAVLKEFAKLTDNQKDTIRKTIEEMVRVNENLSSSKPDVCPVCIQSFIAVIFMTKRSDGIAAAAVISLHITITSNLKIGRDVFLEICLDTLNMVPIKKTAERLDVSVQCVFNNRHKLLSLLEEILQQEDVMNH